MDLQGEYRIDAPKDAVWRALNDPEILKQCIPGCESIEVTGENEFSAKVTAKIGPVKAKFGGKVTLSDLDPPNGYTITGEGSGGAAGFAKGNARIELADDGDATVLRYNADAQVGGKLAQIGSRLVKGSAKKTADDFFSAFSEIVSRSSANAAGNTADSQLASSATVASDEKSVEEATPGGIPAWIWLAGMVVIVAAALAFFL